MNPTILTSPVLPPLQSLASWLPLAVVVTAFVVALVAFAGVVTGWVLAYTHERRSEIAQRKLAEAVAAAIVKSTFTQGRN
jgi:multisubunit Na+/H+ antiporter MnhC subunit